LDSPSGETCVLVAHISSRQLITQPKWIKRICEKNILIKHEEELPINSRVVGVSCASHFTHSVVQTTAVLPVHVLAVRENFHIIFSSSQAEYKARYSSYSVGIKYKTVLRHSKTQWLIT
jgi:hypothetical protein